MSSTLGKWLAGLALLVLALLALLAGAVHHYLNDTRKLEALAAKQLGRAVRIGEITGLHLGRDTRVELRELSIANPAWAEEQYLLQLHSLRVHLDLASLWSDGPVVISDLEVSGLRANLLAPEGESPSWALDLGSDEPAEPAQGPVQLPVYLAQAHIRDSQVIYRDPERDVLAKLEGQLEGEGGIRVHLSGVAQGQSIDFSGHLDREGTAAILSASGDLAGWQVDATARLAEPLAFSGLDASVDVSGQWQAQPDDSDAGLPVHLQVKLTGNGDNLHLRQGSIKAGQTVIEAEGALGNLNTLQGMALSLSANSPDLRELSPAPELDAPVTLTLKTRLTSSGDRLRFQDIAGNSGEGRIRGSAEWVLADDFSGSQAQLNASGERLGQLLQPWLPAVPVDTHYDIDARAEWQAPVLTLDQVDMEFGENQLRADFNVDLGGEKPALSGKVKATGKRAHRVLESLGLDSPVPDESYLLSASLALADSGEMQLSDLDIQLGSSELRGEAFYAPGQPAQVRAKLVAPRLDFRFLSAPVADNDAAPEHNYSNSEALTDKQLADRVIPDTPLNFNWLSAYEGQLELRIEEIRYADNIRSSGELKLVMKEGALTSEKFEWRGEFSAGKAQLALRETAKGAAVELSLDSRRLPLMWLLTGNDSPNNSIHYHTQLSSEGGSLAQLASALDGQLALKGTGGRFSNAGMNLILGDLFGEIVSRIDPTSHQEPYINVECQAGSMTIAEGVINLAPGIALRTHKLDVGLGGTINLGTEALNLVFNTRARKGVGISASKAVTPYVKLGGNFSHPRVGVNAKGVVISGGLAMATGGMSIVAEGMWDRWVATAANPCEALSSQASKGSEELRKLFGRP